MTWGGLAPTPASHKGRYCLFPLFLRPVRLPWVAAALDAPTVAHPAQVPGNERPGPPAPSVAGAAAASPSPLVETIAEFFLRTQFMASHKIAFPFVYVLFPP